MLIGPTIKRRSNAKTAYGLMSDIKTYILEEPKRIWMGDWIIKGHINIQEIFDTEGPACGTVGCIAGNAVVLTSTIPSNSIYTEAMKILSGKEDYENIELKRHLGCLFLTADIDARYGTKKYARIVAGMIDRFQRDYKTVLRSVKV